jgi:hypothetical protein
MLHLLRALTPSQRSVVLGELSRLDVSSGHRPPAPVWTRLKQGTR